MNSGNLFLLSWDMLGLDCVVNITEIEKEATWNTLQNKPTHTLGNTVNSVIMRARANSQRHYEVYTVTMEDGITNQDLREMFDQNPQASAELIRKHGHKIYSDRYNDGNRAKIV